MTAAIDGPYKLVLMFGEHLAQAAIAAASAGLPLLLVAADVVLLLPPSMCCHVGWSYHLYVPC